MRALDDRVPMNLLQSLRLASVPGAPDVVAFVGGGGKSSAMFTLAQELVAAGRRVVTTTTTRIAAAQIASAPVFVPVLDARLPLDPIAAALDAHGHCLLIGRETVEHGAVYKRAGVDAAIIDALVAQSETLGLAAVLIEADGSRMLPFKAPAAHEPVLPRSVTLLVPVAGMDVIGQRLDAQHVHRPERIRALLGLPVEPAELRVTPAHVAAILRSPDGGCKGRGTARAVALLNKTDLPARRSVARLTARLLAETGMPAVLGAVNRAAAPVDERWGPWTAVVLAAGASRRMGTPKQLLAVDGEPMVVRAVRTSLAAGAPEVVVVIGAHGDAVRAVLADALAGTPAPMRIVDNPAWDAGQASSVVAAVEALGATTQAAVFLPVDQPFLPPTLLRQLVEAWQRGADVAAPVVDDQLRGAPCLFDRRLWPELLALTGDVGGRAVLRRHVSQATGVPATDALLRDLDTPEQVAHAQKSSGS